MNLKVKFNPMPQCYGYYNADDIKCQNCEKEIFKKCRAILRRRYG